VLAAQDPPVVLVLDDFHLLTEPGILERLDYVPRNAKSGLHLIVASQADPLRAAGEAVRYAAEEGLAAPGPAS
jgi:ATP/maltotriose-dependent transcriptional regulator MalT